MSSPPDTAWLLARAWPDAVLTFVSDAGHEGSATLHARMVAALQEFARR